MDPVRDVFKQPAEEVRRDPTRRAIVEFRKGELADPIDGHEQIQLALLGPDLGEIDVDVAHRIGFERLARPSARGRRDPTDPVALKKPMQRGPRQVGNRRLQRVEAIIEGQERASAELDDQRFLVGRQHR